MYAGFLSASQFASSDLDQSVNSDHAEIQCVYDGITFASLNISNKHYHTYFSMDQNGPFRLTHLAVTSESSIEQQTWLKNKHHIQINNIKNNLYSGLIDVYVIQEAYVEFVHDLRNSLANNFELHHVSLDNFSPEKNITVIIVNRSKLDIVDRQIYRASYNEIGNKPDRMSELVVPTVTLTNSHMTPQKFVTCAGVHVGGNAAQYPKYGLMELQHILANICEKNNVIALGDFNTTTSNIRSIMNHSRVSRNRLLVSEPLYPTHINPFNEVVAYDNIVYTDGPEFIQHNYDVCPPDSMMYVRALLNKSDY